VLYSPKNNPGVQYYAHPEIANDLKRRVGILEVGTNRVTELRRMDEDYEITIRESSEYPMTLQINVGSVAESYIYKRVVALYERLNAIIYMRSNATRELNSVHADLSVDLSVSK
jgi:hypothetical protein